MDKRGKYIKYSIFEFINNDVDVVVGLLILCKKTNRVLLIQRNDKNKYWSLISGGYDKKTDSNYLNCIAREMVEELRFYNISDIKIITGGDEFIKSKNRNFKYYYGTVDYEFEVTLDDENLNWGWFSMDSQKESKINNQFNSFGLPENLYPGLIQKIQTLYSLKI